MEQTPGQLLREARSRHGVSQQRLAIRGGTTQSAISRIEADRISPSIRTLRELLHVLGEDLTLGSTPRDFGIDSTLNQERLKLSPSDRIKQGVAFSDFVRENLGEKFGGRAD